VFDLHGLLCGGWTTGVSSVVEIDTFFETVREGKIVREKSNFDFT